MDFTGHFNLGDSLQARFGPRARDSAPPLSYWLTSCSTSICDTVQLQKVTSCAGGHHESRYASAPYKLTISSYLFARWHLFRHVGYNIGHQQQVDHCLIDLQAAAYDLLTLQLVSKSCVTWATSVPILIFLGLCSRVRPDVCDMSDRQTSDKSIA